MYSKCQQCALDSQAYGSMGRMLLWLAQILVLLLDDADLLVQSNAGGTGEGQIEFLTHPFAAGERTQESAIQLAGTTSVSKNVLPCWSINRGRGKRIGPWGPACAVPS